MGAGIFWSTAVTGALVLLGVWLRDRRRDRRRTLPDTLAVRLDQAAATADRHVDIWQSLNRQCQAGDNWPEHDEDADDDGCWCRSCYAVEIKRLQDAEIGELFAGLVDTPELRDLADRAERGLR